MAINTVIAAIETIRGTVALCKSSEWSSGKSHKKKNMIHGRFRTKEQAVIRNPLRRSTARRP